MKLKLPSGLLLWTENKIGFGLSINYIPPRMGYEPFIVGQFLWIMFFIGPDPF